MSNILLSNGLKKNFLILLENEVDHGVFNLYYKYLKQREGWRSVGPYLAWGQRAEESLNDFLTVFLVVLIFILFLFFFLVFII